MVASRHTTAATYFLLFQVKICWECPTSSHKLQRQHPALGINPAPLKMSYSYPGGNWRAEVQGFFTHTLLHGETSQKSACPDVTRDTQKVQENLQFQLIITDGTGEFGECRNGDRRNCSCIVRRIKDLSVFAATRTQGLHVGSDQQGWSAGAPGGGRTGGQTVLFHLATEPKKSHVIPFVEPSGFATP